MTSEWVAAAAAVAAALVGPFASVYVGSRQNRAATVIARRQIRASLVSANRQAWIDELRDAIAEFESLLYQLGFRGSHAYGRLTDDEGYQKAVYLRLRIALLVNPAEAVHSQLVTQMDQSLSIVYTPGEEGRCELTQSQAAITTKTQRVLKREWERVKVGESCFSTGAKELSPSRHSRSSRADV